VQRRAATHPWTKRGFPRFGWFAGRVALGSRSARKRGKRPSWQIGRKLREEYKFSRVCSRNLIRSSSYAESRQKMLITYRNLETRCGGTQRSDDLSPVAGHDYIFNSCQIFRSPSHYGQESPRRCSQSFHSCLTRRSIWAGQFQRSKNILRPTRRPYRLHRKSITPVRRSARWVAQKCTPDMRSD